MGGLSRWSRQSRCWLASATPRALSPARRSTRAEGAEAPVAPQSSRSVRLGISAGGCVGFHPDREDCLVRVESAAALGQAAKAQRQRLGMTQAEVALVAGVGVRFIGELEAGKPSLQLERVVRVVRALGFELQLALP